VAADRLPRLTRLRRELARWAPAFGGFAVSLGVSDMLSRHWYGTAGDVALIVAGVLCLACWVGQTIHDTNERLRQEILLCARIWPGLQAREIGEKCHLRPGRLYPLLDQLVEAGELLRDRDGSRLTYRANT
jgi:hypothetical protein